jgi:hypothetical protein
MGQVVEMEEGLRCALAFADPWALHVVSDSSLNVYRYTLEEKGINGLQTQIVKRQFRIAQLVLITPWYRTCPPRKWPLQSLVSSRD